MAKIIHTTKREVKFGDYTVYNLPVNLDFVKHIRKTTLKMEGEDKPAIEFIGTEETWLFDEKEERDQAYSQIMGMDNVKLIEGVRIQ